MDVLRVWAILTDESNHNTERADALCALAEWLARGGFVPIDASADDLRPESFNDSANVLLASAVRCAVANDDLSGLDGCGFEVIR